MNGAMRIQSLLESELRRNLQFSIVDLEIEGASDRPGLRRGDRVRFRVIARNDADVPFRRVAGFVSETRFAAFRPIRFEVRDLRPREEAVLGSIEARILDDPGDFEGTDWLARVTLIASATVEEVTIRESERGIAYHPPRRGRSFGDAPRSIPLSS